MPAQARVVRVGDIARGEDVRVGRAEVLVDDDPVADLEPGVRRELGIGCDPHPDEDQVGGDPAAVAQNDAGHRTVPASQLGNRNLTAQVYAVVAVQFGEDGRGLRAEDAQQWHSGGLEEGDVQSGVAGSGRGLQADPAGADDRDPLRAGEAGLDAVTVPEAA
jgi:hypothetical protein